jgi:hypothetical protein
MRGEKVYKASILPEAYLVRDALRMRGIPAEVRGEHLAGAVGGLAAEVLGPEVWVAGEDAEAARGIISNARARSTDGGLSFLDDAAGALSEVAPERCPACGAEWEPGFEVCWSCEHELPDDGG